MLTVLCVGMILLYTHGLYTHDAAEALFEEKVGLFLTVVRTAIRTVRLFQQISRQRMNMVAKVDIR